MEELYKKDLHDPDNHNGVITHLEPDILECEVKWALESITTNKASGGDRIPVELFQIDRSRLPLFWQGGATVSLMIELSVARDQGGSIFIGRFVEAIRETLVRRDVLGIL